MKGQFEETIKALTLALRKVNHLCPHCYIWTGVSDHTRS